jgi:predicted kinase
MFSNNLILVTGFPGTGKTTLARKIAEDYKLPLLERDAIKLLLLRELGFRDRAWSRKIGKTSYDILYYAIEQHLKSEGSIVIESDFGPHFANEIFEQWSITYNFSCLQIICNAEKEIIIQRFKTRMSKDVNHPSFSEGDEGIKDLLQTISPGIRSPLHIANKVINVDTTKVELIEYERIYEQINQFISKYK